MATSSPPPANWQELLAWLLRRRKRIRVEGTSMRPTLNPADMLFYQPSALMREGSIVVARDPRIPTRKLVKRVSKLDIPGKRVYLLGDNPTESTDSRHFGWVSFQHVLGVVTSILR